RSREVKIQWRAADRPPNPHGKTIDEGKPETLDVNTRHVAGTVHRRARGREEIGARKQPRQSPTYLAGGARALRYHADSWKLVGRVGAEVHGKAKRGRERVPGFGSTVRRCSLLAATARHRGQVPPVQTGK